MREFERKRLEEKIRKVASIPPAPLKIQPLPVPEEEVKSNTVSTSGLYPNEDKPMAVEDCSTNEANHQPLIKSETCSITHSSPDDAVTSAESVSVNTVKTESNDVKKDDNACELPSSSVEVPPVPVYEEIEQCIYKVESKKKAVSLM
ncbi:unnamed protein product [Strongylus vulgaris]|uniref:Uncharacterized protein n=1 Tax=Strongylus vulgaris TaxID=40348 RepID=A0A3P7LRE8_STRVU|nr:unnamed protein product [Strongylus vulgaris]